MDILLNVTNLCNARCKMCNIWHNKKNETSFMNPDWLASVHGARTVTFAGGEPFMHRGIIDIAKAIHVASPKARLIFSTNGFQSDHISRSVTEILKFCQNMHVTISLDGLARKHDAIRGTDGAWESINRTYDKLKTSGLRRVNFGFTLLEDNIGDLPKVLDFALSKGAEMSFVVAQSKNYLGVSMPPVDFNRAFPVLNPVIDLLLLQWKPKSWVRAFHMYGWLSFMMTQKRPLPCRTLEGFAMINERGDVCSCNQLAIPVGNLRAARLTEILSSDRAVQVRHELRKCYDCWGIQETRSAVRANIIRVGLWIMTNKTLVHLGLRNGKRRSVLFASAGECS